MTAANFVTCRCQHCDKGIEFDAGQLSNENNYIPCPHCGLDTILFVPQAPEILNQKSWKDTADIVLHWMVSNFGKLILGVFAILLIGVLIVSAIQLGADTIVTGLFQIVGSLLAIALVFFVYFLPYYVASRHGKNNKQAILVLNLFLGWTFIGWVVALVWASTKDGSR